VSENRVVRIIFGNKKEEIEDIRKFHNEELHNTYSSSNNTRVIDSRAMRCAKGLNTCGKEEKCTQSLDPKIWRKYFI
jgi:hypothetical protein